MLRFIGFEDASLVIFSALSFIESFNELKTKKQFHLIKLYIGWCASKTDSTPLILCSFRLDCWHATLLVKTGIKIFICGGSSAKFN